MLEDAVGLAGRGDGLADLEPAGAEGDHLPGLDLAQQLRADDVERAALGGDDEVGTDPAHLQGADAWGVAEGAIPSFVITTV